MPSPESSQDAWAYRITGLDCAEESAALEREVGRIPGVARLEFDLLRGRMTVHGDPALVRPEQLVRAVARTGMQAHPWSSGTARADPTSEGLERGRVWTVAAGALLLACGTATHVWLHGDLADALFGRAPGSVHRMPWISLLFYLASILAGCRFILPKAWHALRRLRPDMNLLMVIAVIGAASIDQWFEAATVAVLFAVANLLEQWSVVRARRAVGALLELAPTTARYLCPKDGDILEKPVDQVPAGAVVLVRPGERIPLDGVVVAGESRVDQAPITGESALVPKHPGDPVFAGTVNQDGALRFRSTKPASDTTLARIIRLVEQARSRRAPSERWVESFARYYTPAMMLLALLTAGVPPLIFGASWGKWFYEGLVILVIACPCALVISTPVSVVSGLAAAARAGVLVKGGLHLEGIARIRALALDKTGTLTYGRPRVRAVVPLNGHNEVDLLARAAALEQESEHPLARAILGRAAQLGVPLPGPVTQFQIKKGRGAEARLAGRAFWLGNRRFAREKGALTPELGQAIDRLEDAGHSVVILGAGRHACGLLGITDAPRENARDTLRALERLGLNPIVMLTGDNRGTARRVARGLALDEVYAELLPEDKVAHIEKLRRSYGPTAMIGDGVNDAPAMAVADAAVAMGKMGTDAAIETADIVLMGDDLAQFPWLIQHARGVLRTIQQNIAFALGLKIGFIGLTFLGVASLWLAIMADTGASLLVTFNALRLLKNRPVRPESEESPCACPGRERPCSAGSSPGDAL